MAWVRLDDGFFRHRKVVQAGRDARDLDLASWCFASASLSDGFIPLEALRQLAADAQVANPKRLAARLVEVGLWEDAPGGYWIHDYLEFNPTRERVLATRAARADAGRVGGRRSGDVRRERPDQPEVSPEAKQRAKVIRSEGGATAEQIASPVASPLLQEVSKQKRTTSHGPSHGPSPSGYPEQPAEQTETGGETHILRARAMAPQARSVDDEFEDWWEVYPRRENKQAARESYRRRRKSGRTVEALKAAAQNLADYFERGETEMRYRPHASTFLNQRRDEEWEHGPPVPQEEPNGRAIRVVRREEPRGFEGLREAFADLDPRRHALDAATGL